MGVTWCLALHGGAGQLARSRGGPADRDGGPRAPGEHVHEMQRDLGRALAAGVAVLERSGSALAAVVAAVVVLEDSVHFNAGRGSVLRSDGSVRMDSSLMCGRTRAAGAVAGVRYVQNPIRAAECVLADGRHVLRAGEHADRFAREQQLPTKPAE